MPGHGQDPADGMLQNLLEKITSGEPRLKWSRVAVAWASVAAAATPCLNWLEASSVTSAMQDAASGFRDFWLPYDCKFDNHVDVSGIHPSPCRKPMGSFEASSSNHWRNIDLAMIRGTSSGPCKFRWLLGYIGCVYTSYMLPGNTSGNPLRSQRLRPFQSMNTVMVIGKLGSSRYLFWIFTSCYPTCTKSS